MLKDRIYAYVDGAVRNNQSTENLGAWGVILLYKTNEKEFSGIVENTTSNICEITAAISALSKIKDKSIPVDVISDSQYVVSGVNDWSKKWIKEGWKNSKNKPVENQELWRWLLDLVSQFEDVRFVKCQGHSDDEYNNKVDKLCNKAMDYFIATGEVYE
jgi:ribonuclease HI